MISFLNWINLRMMETHEGHSGLELPFSPFGVFPFAMGGEYHSFHHEKNTGNYGSFTSLWDRVFGTDQPYLDSIEEKERKEKAENNANKQKAE